jgi:hypothetical protein
MIDRVSLRYFKRFQSQQFDLDRHIVLAGHNNAGKTTLLQAISVWNLALRRWMALRGPETSSKALQRTGIPITRAEFTAIPLREMNLLWTDASTALKVHELQSGHKLGTPRPIVIELSGESGAARWKLGFELRYQNSELIYAKPAQSDLNDVARAAADVQVVHVPPFSGIGSQETGHDRAYQDMLIGQGKPGDILRNLLHELNGRPDRGPWNDLVGQVQEIFGYTLLPPQYENRPYILSEYVPGMPTPGKSGLPRLDISNGGSGFLQVLVLLGFLYARPATVLLLDEPDAHQHIILQKQIYDRIRRIAEVRKCQLVIATHSEVIVEDTSPGQVMSFFEQPHRLVTGVERDQVREALKRITAMDILRAESSPGVLYLEGETDFNLLTAWARVLNHPMFSAWFDRYPFWHSNKGRNPREARAHLFALRAVKPGVRGFLILDGDNRNLPDVEVGAADMTIARWTRYESESYLLHPDALTRYVAARNGNLFAATARAYMEDQLPPAVIRDPLGDHDYLRATPASKTILPAILDAGDVRIDKNEYFLIAEQMRPDEIAPDVPRMLDRVADAFGIGTQA